MTLLAQLHLCPAAEVLPCTEMFLLSFTTARLHGAAAFWETTAVHWAAAQGQGWACEG